MRWDHSYRSNDIEDRRGESFSGGGFGGGMGRLGLLLIFSLFGWKGMLVGLLLVAVLGGGGMCVGGSNPDTTQRSRSSSGATG